MHGLLVLLAFTLAAVVTYAVVLAVLSAASAAADEPWLDAEVRFDEADDVDEGCRGTRVSC
jgi:hypothetical protein